MESGALSSLLCRAGTHSNASFSPPRTGEGVSTKRAFQANSPSVCLSDRLLTDREADQDERMYFNFICIPFIPDAARNKYVWFFLPFL